MCAAGWEARARIDCACAGRAAVVPNGRGLGGAWSLGSRWRRRCARCVVVGRWELIKKLCNDLSPYLYSTLDAYKRTPCLRNLCDNFELGTLARRDWDAQTFEDVRMLDDCVQRGRFPRSYAASRIRHVTHLARRDHEQVTVSDTLGMVPVELLLLRWINWQVRTPYVPTA